jgi:hypothetical protein
MTSLPQEMEPQQMSTRSGKSYGPLHPGVLQVIEGIVDKVQVALGPTDPQGPKDLEKIRRLLRRLKGMLHLSRESEYWNIVLPAMLSRFTDRLFEVDEFWAPAIVRDLISIINIDYFKRP